MFHLNFTLVPHFSCIFSRKKQRHFCRCFKSCICRFMSKLCSYFFISKLHSRQEYHEQDQIHRELDKIFRYSRCAVCKKTAHSFFCEVCDAKSLVYIKCIQEIRIKSYITEKYNTSSCNCDLYYRYALRTCGMRNVYICAGLSRIYSAEQISESLQPTACNGSYYFRYHLWLSVV